MMQTAPPRGWRGSGRNLTELEKKLSTFVSRGPAMVNTQAVRQVFGAENADAIVQQRAPRWRKRFAPRGECE
jgi:hypothetical protein